MLLYLTCFSINEICVCSKKNKPQLLKGTLKRNVEIAVTKQGNVGPIAAVCRSDTGALLETSSWILQGLYDPTILEALVCRETLGHL